MFRRSEHERVEGLLSAYLDGELSREEKALVEEHLKRCASCAENLEGLRQTVALVRQLPAVSPPRSFTISHLVAKERPWPWAYAYLRGATALAALLLIAFLATDMGVHYLWRGGAALPAPQPMPMEAPAVVPEEEEVALGLAPEESPLPAEKAPPDRAAEIPPGPTVLPTPAAETPTPVEEIVPQGEWLSATPTVTPSPQPTPEGTAYALNEGRGEAPAFLPWLRPLEWLSLSTFLLLATSTAGVAWWRRRRWR